MDPDTVRKTQRLFDETEQRWYDVYTAPGIAGTPITAIVPREEQAERVVRRALLSKGAKLPPDPAGAAAVTAAIATEAPVVHRAARTGWRDDEDVFVSHHHVAGVGQGVTVMPPESAIAVMRNLRSRGTLEGWCQLVLAAAAYSMAIVVALCAAFAAPLLKLLRRPSFGLVFVAPSRFGKSTAQLLGASVLGFGAEEDLPALNATEAGLMAAALTFNDHLLTINEVGTARGEKKDVYSVLRAATYSLMNGQDIMRHPSWAGANGPSPSSFQVITLLSSELSPDAWAARAAEARDAGESARLIGVPLASGGRSTIFDRWPLGLRGEKLDLWMTEQFQRIRDGLPKHSGTAGPAYLDALANDVPSYTALARKAVDRFIKVVAKPSFTPVQRDIVGKFGVLYAGGFLAHRTGVLPWDRKMMGRAVWRACLAALDDLPDPAREARADLQLLRERLSGGGVLDLEACTAKQRRLIRSADGYHEPKWTGRRFVVRAEVFAGWFSSQLRLRRTLEWLDKEGLLDHAREPTQGRSIEWAQRQLTWPDQTRVRSIALYLPSGLNDLA